MTDVAEFTVFCPGMLEVLSIGRGDLKIVVGDNDEDRDRARVIIQEMLAKGYTIFVETAADLPVRVSSFDPDAMAYIITEAAPAAPAAAAAADDEAVDGAKPKGRAKKTTRVPVAGTKATAVGRTAGG